MTSASTDLRFACPGFPVASVDTAIEFYTRRLGFICIYTLKPVDSPYGIVERGHVAIHLQRSVEHSGHAFCYLNVVDADALYQECLGQGVTIQRHIENSSYGMRDFVIVDCFGNQIQIGHPITA